MIRSSLLTRASFVVAAVLLGFTPRLPGSETLHWNDVALQTTTRVMPLDPVTESRILAIVHLAMHNAANAVQPRYRTYGPVPSASEDTSVDAAIASAAWTSLRQLMPANSAEFDAEFERRISARKAPANARGIEIGKAIATALLQQRAEDGSADVTSRADGVAPGEHRPTPPDFTPALLSHWGRVRPFALKSPQQFRPAPPPAIGSRQQRLDLEEVRLLGGVESTVRTHEQSEIACYWYEMSTRGWNRIARDVVATRKLDQWEQARLLALVHVAMADGFIGGFEAKYHYYHWRPATALRESGHPQWLSYLQTPPVPDYPSTHTVLGAAAAAVLARALGTDYVSFAMTCGGPYSNITRRYWSFSQAARENGASRVFAGLHFTSAVNAGYEQGDAIGTWVFENTLQPIASEKPLVAAAAR